MLKFKMTLKMAAFQDKFSILMLTGRDSSVGSVSASYASEHEIDPRVRRILS